jgi:integrase/recombinase XerD
MAPKRLKSVDWSIRAEAEDFKPILRRFNSYRKGIGLRESTITDYVGRLGRYLKYAQTDQPSVDTAKAYRDQLTARNLARSTVNNCSFALKKFYEMIGIKIDFPFLDRNDNIPYYFDEEDVSKIFAVCRNIKHLAMLKTLFYGCLRASELCNLDDDDIDMKSQNMRITEGKGGKDGIIFIREECIKIVKQYLMIRPNLSINGSQPLFYTIYGQRYDRSDIHRMFVHYKTKAGISKPGGVHCFARHTTATIMIAHGCDIRIVQKILRNKDIRTTLRYAHVSDKTQREAYEKFLTL